MKRLVQVWMVAIALLVGAQAVQAAPIATLKWLDDPSVGDVGFEVMNFDLSSGLDITDLQLFVNGGATPVAMTLTTLQLFDISFNLDSFAPGTVSSVSISFVHNGLLYVAGLDDDDLIDIPGVVCDPLEDGCFPADPYRLADLTIDEQVVSVPEPLSLSLLGLGLAATALARRRRH